MRQTRQLHQERKSDLDRTTRGGIGCCVDRLLGLSALRYDLNGYHGVIAGTPGSPFLSRFSCINERGKDAVTTT